MFRFFHRKPQRRPTPGPELPPHFAEEVLDLEGEVAMHCTLKDVLRLIELYTLATEHYEAIQDSKYLHYQDRITALLTRKDVQLLLDASKPPLSPKPAVKAQRRLSASSSRPQLRLTPVLGERSLRRLGTTGGEKLNKSCGNLFKHSENSSLMAIPEESDRSGGPVSVMDTLSSEIERILEKYSDRKHAARRHIELKFSEHLEALREADPQRVTPAVTEELLQQMQEEVQIECQRIDRMKERELLLIKREFNAIS